MKSLLASIAKRCTEIAATALGWLAIFNLNGILFGNLAQAPRVHWIFLPAGFRPLAVLLFDKAGAAGLAVGTYLTLRGTPGSAGLHAILYSNIKGATPWVAVSLGRKAMGIPLSLAGLKPPHVITISALCAGLNALTASGYFWGVGQMQHSLTQVAALLVGDILGSGIVLFLLSSGLALVMPRQAGA